MKTVCSSLVLVVSMGVGSGCSAGGGTPNPGNGAPVDSAGGNSGTLFGSGGSQLGDGGGPGFGSGGSGQVTKTDGGCPRVTQKAEKQLGGKADIIWVLDNSGSMFDESVGIQNNMNAFSSYITGTGIDVHVIAVSAAPGPVIVVQIPPFGLCIAPPLGSGQACPNDTNPPLYTHVLQEVDSHNALQQLMGTYPQWASALRPDASKTFIVVTDDAANPTPTAADFTTFFNDKFQGALWRFDGVFCKSKAAGANCSGDGTVYAGLVDQTHGIYSDLAAPDWNSIFQTLGAGVVADARPVDCQWTIPPPPAGTRFSPDKVNVEFTPTSGLVETLYGVDSQAECQDPAGGWFFDNNAAPANVVACPASCTKMQADLNAQVNVVFGCDKKRPPAR